MGSCLKSYGVLRITLASLPVCNLRRREGSNHRSPRESVVFFFARAEEALGTSLNSKLFLVSSDVTVAVSPEASSSRKIGSKGSLPCTFPRDPLATEPDEPASMRTLYSPSGRPSPAPALNANPPSLPMLAVLVIGGFGRDENDLSRSQRLARRGARPFP